MTENSDTFFKELGTRGYEPLLHRVTGTYEFDIAGASRWLIRVDAGKIHVFELSPDSKRQDKVDCKIVCSGEDFNEILQGTQDEVTSYMQGRIQIIGDLAMAASFQRLFGAAPVPSVH